MFSIDTDNEYIIKESANRFISFNMKKIISSSRLIRSQQRIEILYQALACDIARRSKKGTLL